MTERTLLIKERGQTDVSRDVWVTLSEDRNFRRLLETGVVAVSLLPSGRVRLQGACYVGRARCAHVDIDLQEKVPGALEALLPYATSATFRVERVPRAASDVGSLIGLLIEQFLAAASTYTSRSREFTYVRERMFGSLAGGRIDVAKSLVLRARGLGHLLAFDKDVVTLSTPLNRVVLAALIEVERLAHIVDIRSAITTRARGLALLFADCRDTQVLFGDRSHLARLANDVAVSHQLPQESDVAALASVILARQSFESRTETGSRVPRSWFLNLESLFERAVITVLRETVAAGTSVFRGGERPQPVFRRSASKYRAHPDIILNSDGGQVTVGDVKYKNWAGTASPSDLYQILVHTSAFCGTTSFLVFPHDEYLALPLGEAATGSITWIFCLDIMDFANSIARMVEVLGVDRSIGPAAAD